MVLLIDLVIYELRQELFTSSCGTIYPKQPFFHFFFTQPIETIQTNSQTQQTQKKTNKCNKQTITTIIIWRSRSVRAFLCPPRSSWFWLAPNAMNQCPRKLSTTGPGFLRVFQAIYFGIVMSYDLWEALWWDILWRVWEISWAVWPLAWPGKAVLSYIGVTRRIWLTPPVMSSLIGKFSYHTIV